MATNGMASVNGNGNGNVTPDQSSRLDPNFTKHVIETMGSNITPRNRQVMTSLIRHLHDFTREIELTNDEWMTGVHFINSLGQNSTGKSNEAFRLCEILGLESLVDEIENKTIYDGDTYPTSSAVLGPLWSPDAPFRANGDSIIQDLVPDGRVCKMHGKVMDLVTNKPIPGAIVDVWEASLNGKYDIQDPHNQSQNNLRGKFRSDDNGNYWFYCYYPTAYSLPTRGPTYEFLKFLDRHPMRPAHIHLIVTHPDFKRCTTQLYPRDDPWLSTDTVFAVKTDLVVDFRPLEGDDRAELELEYDIILSPKSYGAKHLSSHCDHHP